MANVGSKNAKQAELARVSRQPTARRVHAPVQAPSNAGAIARGILVRKTTAIAFHPCRAPCTVTAGWFLLRRATPYALA